MNSKKNIIYRTFFILSLFLNIQHTYAETNSLPIAKYGSDADAVEKEKDIKDGYGTHYLEIAHPLSVALNSLKSEYFQITVYGGYDHEIEWSLTHPKLGNVGKDLLIPFFSPTVVNGGIHINHTAISPKYISEEPYKLNIDILACDESGCSRSNKESLSTKIDLYILAGADAEIFNAPNLSIDALFYIDKNNKKRIGGLEYIQDLITVVDKFSNLDIDEIKAQVENQRKTLGETIIGLTDILSNDLTSIYNTKKQQELHQDQNLLAFLASKELDESTNEDLEKISRLINKHKNGLDSLKNWIPEVSLPKEKINCENNIECKAYLHLTGNLTLNPEILADTGRRNGKNFAEFAIFADEDNPFKVNIKATLGVNANFEKTIEDPWKSPRKQLLSKRLLQIIPTPVGIPIVLSEKFSLFAQVEVSGKLEAGAKVEFSYNKEEIFAAGVSYNGNDYNLNGESCTEKLGNTAFKVYRCRSTKKDAFSIKGIVKGEATAEAVLWIYPEIEFMVYRNVGANLSLEPGLYAKTTIKAEYTVEQEIETIAQNEQQYIDANYQFTELELGVKARVRFRADLGLIYKKAGKEKTLGLAYPLCAGICSREEREVINIGSYPLINLPKVTPATTGSLGNELTLVAQIDSGKFFTQSDGDNDINGYSWQLVGKAKDALGLPLSVDIPSTPVRVDEIKQKVTVADSSKLEAGETYTVRLVYWSEIHKIVRQYEDFDIIYNPPQDDPNLAVSISLGLNVKLTWDKVASSTEYWIYKNGVLLTTVSATGDTTYEYIDTDSEISGSYTYQIVPVSDGGVQYNSPVISYPASNLPIAPTNLTVTASPDAMIKISWDNMDDGNTYKWHIAKESFSNLAVDNYNALSGYNAHEVTLSSGITGVGVGSLTNDIKHYFVVTKIVDSKESLPSNEVSATQVKSSEAITHNGFTYESVTSPHTGRVWLDRNIGASRVCQSYNDAQCYGDYYQWGRYSDGHEKITSSITSELVNNLSSPSSFFAQDLYPSDWVVSGVDDNGNIRIGLWKSTSSKSDPKKSICPPEYRVPYMNELTREINDISVPDAVNTNFLKVPAAGSRLKYPNNNSDMVEVGAQLSLWTNSLAIYDNISVLKGSYQNSAGSTRNISMGYQDRSVGSPVRCTKEVSASNIEEIGTSAIYAQDQDNYALDISNDKKYAYVASATELKILDIRNISNISEIGSVNFNSQISAIKIQGDFAYIARASYLSVVDISNPNSPTLKGELTFSHPILRDVTISGSYAYIANSDAGLKIVDISDPNNPFLKGALDTYDAHKVIVDSNYAYIADYTEGLKIVKIRHKYAPELLSSLPPNTINSWWWGMSKKNNYIYFTNGNGNVDVVDVSDKNIPTLKGTVDVTLGSYGNANSINIYADYAFVTSNGIQVLDIYTPIAPVLIKDMNLNGIGTTWGIKVIDRYVYITSRPVGEIKTVLKVLKF